MEDQGPGIGRSLLFDVSSKGRRVAEEGLGEVVVRCFGELLDEERREVEVAFRGGTDADCVDGESEAGGLARGPDGNERGGHGFVGIERGSGELPEKRYLRSAMVSLVDERADLMLEEGAYQAIECREGISEDSSKEEERKLPRFVASEERGGCLRDLGFLDQVDDREAKSTISG